jgi:hypothetical protein
MIQRSLASSSKGGAAGRTSKRLDALGLAMLAISDQGMHGSVCDPEVPALLVGTSEAMRVYAFGNTPPAFDLTPGAYWRRSRFHAWRGETTGEAIVW